MAAATSSDPLVTEIVRIRPLPLLTTLLLAACGQAYSTQAPPQKQVVSMFLSKTSVFAGQLEELVAYIPTPQPNAIVVEQPDFGGGVVAEYDTDGGEGCSRAPEFQQPVPNYWNPTYVFPVCIQLIPDGPEEIGPRDVTIEISSGGQLIVARAGPFFVVQPPQ